MSDEPKLLMDRLAKLRREVTDEPLHESGRYFNEGTFWDLTQCTHGDTGRFRNDADGKAIAILWELWRSGALVPAPAVPDDVADWRDDPTADERWNAGCDFAMTQLCVVLEVDPKSVSWDAATEELEGDVRSVIGNIITAAFGDDWPTPATIEAQAAELARLREENALMAASLDEEERKHGLSTNGNMWRFWSQQLREYHERRAKERAALTHPTGEPT